MPPALLLDQPSSLRRQNRHHLLVRERTGFLHLLSLAVPVQVSWYHGMPMPSMEVKLVNMKEAGHLTSGAPQCGEVWLCGASVTERYFKRDDLNNDESIFTKDEWFRTGDVGKWNPDETLKLIDRYAPGFLLAYTSCTVSLTTLLMIQDQEPRQIAGWRVHCLGMPEHIYESCNLVGNICVHVVPDVNQPMALIFPHEANLRHYLATTPPPGFTGDAKGADLHALCVNKAIAGAVIKECNVIAKREH